MTSEQQAGSHVHEWGKGWAGWRNGWPEWFQRCVKCGKDRVLPRRKDGPK